MVKCSKSDEKCGDCPHSKSHEWSVGIACVGTSCHCNAYEENGSIRGIITGAACLEIESNLS